MFGNVGTRRLEPARLLVASTRMPSTRISVDLSRLLLAFTIELDNEFEHRMAAALPRRPFRVSAVMWSNFLRFVEKGIPVGELPAACGLPKGAR